MKFTNIRTFIYLVILTISVSGCGMTAQHLEKVYRQKPMNKVLVMGFRVSDDRPILSAAWNAATIEIAKTEAMSICRKAGYNCRVINVNGQAYSAGVKPDTPEDMSKLASNETSPKQPQPETEIPSLPQKRYKPGTKVYALFPAKLQSWPNFEGSDRAKIEIGEEFTVLEESGNHLWVKVKATGSGNEGWAAVKWLTTKNEIGDCHVDKYNDYNYWITHQDQIKIHMDNCWTIYQERSIAHMLYKHTLAIPAKDIEKNRQAYKALLIFDPDSPEYKKKYKYYSMSDEERQKIADEKRRIEETRKKSKVKRLYRSGATSEYWHVVVTPSYRMRIKCALLDAAGNILAVEEQIVDAPFDEVLMRAPGSASDAVVSVRCAGLH